MTIIIRVVMVEIVVVIVGSYEIVIVIVPRIVTTEAVVIIGIVIRPTPAEGKTVIVPPEPCVIGTIIYGRPTPIVTKIDAYTP